MVVSLEINNLPSLRSLADLCRVRTDPALTSLWSRASQVSLAGTTASRGHDFMQRRAERG